MSHATKHVAEKEPQTMAYPYRRILTPVDFDENSMRAVEVAEEFARQNDGTVFLVHVVPMIVPDAGAPVYVDIYKGQEDIARPKLEEIARKHLRGVKYEMFTHMGDPARTILKAERRLAADVVIMATHGRRGFKRVFLGSVAEMVLRESTCPVLTVRQGAPESNLVARWMTASPMTATSEEKLSAVATRIDHGGFRGMPVLQDGKVIGMITDRDLRRHTGYLDQTEVSKARSERVLTVTPETTIYDAARLLREHKIGALPVVEDGRLVGMISTTDILEALSSETQ